MPVYRRHKLIHIHIPKTAGTPIEEFFHGIQDMEWGLRSWVGQERRNGRWFEFQHLTYRELAAFTGAEFSSFRSFTVVRDPYQRVLSDYHWHRAPPRATFESLDAFLGSIPKDMDRRWEEHAAQADQARTNVLIHVRPQHQYVIDLTGRCLIDHLLRFETLDRDIAALLDPYGLSGAFIRSRRPRALSRHLNRAQKDLINEIYAKDFEHFGYEME